MLNQLQCFRMVLHIKTFTHTSSHLSVSAVSGCPLSQETAILGHPAVPPTLRKTIPTGLADGLTPSPTSSIQRLLATGDSGGARRYVSQRIKRGFVYVATGELSLLLGMAFQV